MFFYRLCAKVVLNIKWQQLPDDDQGKANFSQTIANTHQQLVNTGFNRFELLTQLIENPWTDPTLSKIMSGDDKEESSGSDTETEETERGNIIHLMLEANLIPYIQKCHDLSVKDISHRACFFHTLYMMVFMVYTLEEYVNSKCSSSKVKVKYLYFHTNT